MCSVFITHTLYLILSYTWRYTVKGSRHSVSFVALLYFTCIYFDKNFNNRYFITLEITLIHTVDIEDNKYYLNNIMEKVIPESKTKLLQNVWKKFCKSFVLDYRSQRLDKNGRMVPSILQFQSKTNIKEGQDMCKNVVYFKLL